ncbi:MAG: PspA/IM30 family protein [Candidatus Thiodiazotropha sp. (ex Dulcina madagascariensis)]|nr:PspA/IM30 family protein [Candidatus Thiodiazotropha sp. (ex Dulcina madagascariensis)]
MSILKDIFTAIRGGASEAGEAIVDANAIRILEQEVRDAETAIAKAKQSLNRLKSAEIKLKREINSLNTDYDDYEAKAIEALNIGKEALAEEVAGRLEDIAAERDEKSSEHSALESEVNGINKLIRSREKIIQKNKRELEKVKTIKEVQKATTSISDNVAATSSSQHRVTKALDRVKAKQQNWRDNMEAGEWMETQEQGDDLDARLKKSGVGASEGSNKSAILERLKAKRKAG